jgi:hypothetical protein
MYRHINEDKRKTESQMQMFEVLRDIEDCPVSRLIPTFFLLLVSLSISSSYNYYNIVFVLLVSG